MSSITKSNVGIGTLAGANGTFSLPNNTGQYITSSNMSSTYNTVSMADSAITIDGGVNGKMSVNVPLLVDGRNVMRELDELRDAMLLLKRHVDMEAKYPKLKKIKDEYERALEKYKTFDAIKESK